MHGLIYVNADNIDEVEAMLDPYYNEEFDYWVPVGSSNEVIANWDLPNQISNKDYRTAAWFLEAQERIDKSWRALLPIAERILGRQLDPNGFEVTNEEKDKLLKGTKLRCINTYGFLLEQGVNLVGPLESPPIWTIGGFLIRKPTFFEGCAYMGPGDSWNEIETEADGMDRIKAVPPESKIWLVYYHV